MDDKEHSRYQWINISEIRKLKDSIGLQKEINAYEKFVGERKNSLIYGVNGICRKYSIFSKNHRKS